jgi:hypothetical protein
MADRTCAREGCGGTVIARRISQRYCSVDCRKKDWHAGHPRQPVTRTCCHPDGCSRKAMREYGAKMAWCSMHYFRIRNHGSPGAAEALTNRGKGWTDRQLNIFLNHGMTPEEWDDLFNRQGRRCGCCGSKSPRSKKGWHTDHDHSTGEVVGILCHKCNIRIHADTTEAELVALLQYFRRTRSARQLVLPGAGSTPPVTFPRRRGPTQEHR